MLCTTTLWSEPEAKSPADLTFCIQQFRVCKDTLQQGPTPAAEVADPGAPRCPTGYECHRKGSGSWFSLGEMQAIDFKLIELEAKLEDAKVAAPRRFGWSLGCGGLIGPEFNSGATGVSATVGCGAIYGFRF